MPLFKAMHMFEEAGSDGHWCNWGLRCNSDIPLRMLRFEPMTFWSQIQRPNLLTHTPCPLCG